MRSKLPAATVREIRKRLAKYVDQYHGGDWGAFQKAAGLERTTVAGWRSRERSPVPDVDKLVQLRERLGLSLDWLLLGTGTMLYEATSPSDRAAERFRATLTQHLGTSGPEVELWVHGQNNEPVHTQQPRAEHFNRVLPGADTVFALAAELIRPLLSGVLHRLIDWERGRGKVIRVLKDDRSARQVEQELDAECEADLAEYRIDLIALARYAETINRKRRPLFQIINYNEAGDYNEAGPTSAWGTLDPAGRRAKKR